MKSRKGKRDNEKKGRGMKGRRWERRGFWRFGIG